MNVILSSHSDPSPLPVEPLDKTGYESALIEAHEVIDAEAAVPIDAVIHGVRARLHTNNPHWRQFWSANWFGPGQWAALTGGLASDTPRVHVFAIVPDVKTLPWAGYNREQNTAFLVGDTPYGPLQALALTAVARLLAEEQAVHYVPGLCLKEDERGTLVLHPSDLDPVTAISKLMESPRAHLVAPNGVFIRYGLVRMVDGVTMLPTLVIHEKGVQISGYRLFAWLEEFGYLEPRADARCLTLGGEEEYCFARDLDLWRAPEAFAFPVEKAWYVPTLIAAMQPGLIGAMWRGGVENVPPLTPVVLDRLDDWSSQFASALSTSTAPSTRLLLEEEGQEKVVEALCRLRAAPQGRAMVLPEQLWPGHAGGHPWRPFQIERVAFMSSTGPTVLNAAALSKHLTVASANLSWLYEDAITDALTDLLRRATWQSG